MEHSVLNGGTFRDFWWNIQFEGGFFFCRCDGYEGTKNVMVSAKGKHANELSTSVD